MIHLILGGARSGKSSFAQRTALEQQKASQYEVIYVATATATDDEMSARIRRHQLDRPSHWHLAEVPLLLADYLQQAGKHREQILLVDCLTLWLNNQLFEAPKQDFGRLFDELLIELQHAQAHIILVANEVGLGVIPMGEVCRTFVDQAGWLNQRIAKVADKVTFVAAGLPMPLKK